MRGVKEGGQHPPNSRKGGALGQETASMELLLLGYTANATTTPESQETGDTGTSQCIDAATSTIKKLGDSSFLCHPCDTDNDCGRAM